MEHRPTDIGSRLRQAREQRGLSLQDISQSTKITTLVLKAIEANEFSRVPGGLFARGYVRAFAAQVGLNADELVSEYREQFEPQPRAAAVVARVPADRGDTLGRVAVVVFGLGILAAMAMFSRTDQDPLELRPPEPHAVAVAPALETASPAVDDAQSVELVEVAKPGHAGALRMEMRFTGPCWVSAQADGDMVLFRLMQPGERASIDARDAITLRIGDPAAVVYNINGAPGRPLGRAGQAVTLDITADNYQRLLEEAAGQI